MTVHPARFSPSIVTVIGEYLADLGTTHVHDPFGGSGERLGELATTMGLTFTGTEIEASFIVDQRLVHGDATVQATYPRGNFVIVTSPAYPNGISDNFATNPDKESKNWRRITYRHRVAEIEGVPVAQRELHPNNMGRWGYRGRGERSKARDTYWRLACEAVACWSDAEAVILNVSDFMFSRRGEDLIEPVVEPWIDLLSAAGFEVDKISYPDTPRMLLASDESRGKRVQGEAVILARAA